MFGFNYEYLKSYEIFKNMKNLTDYGIMEFLVLLIGLIIIIGMVFYVIPVIKIYFKKNELDREKKRKKRIIDKIVLQKNLEDLIRREIEQKK